MSNIQVTNIKNLSGNQTVAITSTTGELLVKNDLIAESSAEVAENLIVSGVSTFSSLLDINGSIDVSGISTFNNNVNIIQALDVSGHTELDNLRVSGITTFTSIQQNTFGDVNTGSVQFDGGLGIARNVSIGGSLFVSGQSYFAESIKFAAGNSGNIEFGDNSNDTIDVKARIGSDFVPKINTGYDLGYSDKKWRHLYVAGNAGIGSLNVTGVSTFSGSVTLNNTLNAQQVNVSNQSNLTNLNVSGVSTISGAVGFGTNITLMDAARAKFGTGGDLEIYHTGTNSFIVDSGTGDLIIRASEGYVQDQGNANQTWLQFNSGAGVEAHFAGNKKFETTGTGVTVTGNIALIGDGGLIDFVSSTSQTDYETGIRWKEGNNDPSMGIDYNGDSGLDSSGQIEIKGYNNNTSSYDELVVLDRFGRVGVGSTRPTHLVDVLGDSRFTGNVSVSGITTLGIVTGAIYYGNGSNLTGITTIQISGYGEGIGGLVEDTSPQLGGNLDLNSNNITGIGSISITGNASITGTTTFGGNATINGDLDVDGHTELDNLNVSGVSTFKSNAQFTDSIILYFGNGNDLEIKSDGSNGYIRQNTSSLSIYSDELYLRNNTNNEPYLKGVVNGSVELYYDNSKKLETTNTGAAVSGILTATSFYGDGGNLTSLTGASTGTYGDSGSIPVITVDGSGRITGISTATNEGSGENQSVGLSSRSIVEGTTGSLAPDAYGTLNLTGFKSYGLMHVGLSTAGWIRIYTDSTSRTNDASRSIGDDPIPGSGVIAEVITTGISTQQNISPFVMGGNMDNPASNTMYISINNLSSDTQTISVDITILKLEA